MTIDKAYEILSNGLVNASSEHEWCVAFKTAIDTMKKYQKIQEIVTKWQNEPRMKFDTSYYNMTKITEVIEDGEID